MAEAPRARPLAAHKPGFERLDVLDPEQGKHRRARFDNPRGREGDRQSRVVAEPVRGASRGSKAAASPCDRIAGSAVDDDDGEWVKVGARDGSAPAAADEADDFGL